MPHRYPLPARVWPQAGGIFRKIGSQRPFCRGPAPWAFDRLPSLRSHREPASLRSGAKAGGPGRWHSGPGPWLSAPEPSRQGLGPGPKSRGLGQGTGPAAKARGRDVAFRARDRRSRPPGPGPSRKGPGAGPGVWGPGPREAAPSGSEGGRHPAAEVAAGSLDTRASNSSLEFQPGIPGVLSGTEPRVPAGDCQGPDPGPQPPGIEGSLWARTLGAD